MDQSAQPTELENITGDASNYQPPSPFSLKKLLFIAFIGALILIFIAGFLALFVRNGSQQAGVPTPTIRPTATPFPPPTLAYVTEPVATISASTAAKKISSLAFIKDGDIYHSDLTSFSLLVKNTTPAGDQLTWSQKGNLIAWRPKSTLATPNEVTVYNREKNSTFSLEPNKNAEVVNFSFSPDEKQMLLLSHGDSYTVSLFSLDATASAATTIFQRTAEIRQLLWLKDNKIIFSGSDGISSLSLASASVKLIIATQNVIEMKPAPDESKLLYSVGNREKSDLYLVNLDGSNNQQLSTNPTNVDMGKTGLPVSTLSKGFIPNALWFPSGDKLLVGFHYLTNLPLVGIYNLDGNSFTAVSPFYLGADDVMVDEDRLVGARVVTTVGKTPFWQISIFSMENNASLAVIRAIPQAYSPTYFTFP